MFERFSKSARAAVIGAQEEARRWNADAVGTEHVLHALLDTEDPLVEAVLDRLEVDREALRHDLDQVERAPGPPLDADALSTLGIDLDATHHLIITNNINHIKFIICSSCYHHYHEPSSLVNATFAAALSSSH
jgi:hypothetical protein